MAGLKLLPAALAAALALMPLSAFSQETAAPSPGQNADQGAGPGTGHGHGAGARFARSPMIRLDFGAGRTISVQCGETAIAACVEAITPLAEKLAATPAAGPGKDRDHAKGRGGEHHKAHGKDRGKDREKGGAVFRHDKSGQGHDRPAAAPDAPAEAPPVDAPAP
ncbi:hypothetical protein [Rhodobacter sp. 24-YEA-8]|uniref:hypothetical protein n=1 Tax=Rhodobacter sp. 24-YEA-8 TaxID=1884310 RepID=UPI000895B0B3|nr:hypothetical protein [Rhodobacter sp. 24-YEA-8]SEC49891.1 hypothetical protein SAMN05519105_2699 [Rhodobacter sp. 24-YEA-8]